MREAGAIRLDLDLAGGVVCAARLRSNRPATLGRLFHGRQAQEAPELARRLFTLCSRAHGAAALAATEAAMGRRLTGEALRRENRAVLAERAFEILRAPAMTAPTRAVALALRQAAAAAQALANCGGAAPLAALRAAAAELGVLDGEPAPDSVFGRLLRPGSAALPLTAPDPLTGADDGAVAAALLAAPESFAAAPELPGRRPETGAFARVWRELPPFDDALAARGRARLLDARATLAQLEAPDGIASGGLGEGAGFAAVETARGRLYHAVKIDAESKILIYGMAAPTEWNFHPLGPFVATLLGARLGRAEVERLALHMDPCCAFETVIREPA